MANSRGLGSGGVQGSSWASPAEAGGDKTAVPSSGEGSAAAGPSPQSRVAAAGAKALGAGWGRRGGRRDSCGATGDAKGPERSPRGTANDDNGQSPRSNKKKPVPARRRPRGPRRPPVAAGAGAGVPRPQPGAQVQGCPPRGARSAAPGFRAKLRACPREVVAPVQGGKELWEKLGSGDGGGCARALFFFSSTFPLPCLSPEFWLLSFPPPPRSRLLPPPRFSPTSVRYLLGGGGWPKGMSCFHQRHSAKGKLRRWKERE